MNKKLTAEEKTRFAGILQDTWQGIGPDVVGAFGGRYPKPKEIAEIVCDANHPQQYGMTSEEYRRLSECYHHRDTQKWLRQVLN